MTMIVDAQRYISSGAPGRMFYPRPYVKTLAMNWAYGPLEPNHGGPPYARDPDTFASAYEDLVADPTGEETIKEMDAAKVDMTILHAMDLEYMAGASSDTSVEQMHQHLAGIRSEYPARIRVLAGPDPRRPGALETLRRAVDEHGMDGLVLYPSAGYPVWDERAFPLYEYCLDHALPVAVVMHPGSPAARRDRFAQPVHISDVVAEYPDLKLMVVGAGAPLYPWLEEAINSCAQNTNAVFTLSGWIRGTASTFGMTPSFLAGEESVIRILARIKDVMGAHRVLWGSESQTVRKDTELQLDADAPSIADTVAWLIDLPVNAAKYGIRFSEQEAGWILGDNAARVFGISSDPAWHRAEQYGWRRRLPSPFKGIAG